MEDSFRLRKQTARLKKFIRKPRPIIYLWTHGIINPTTYCIYEYLVIYAGFDSRNPHYGLVDLKEEDIAHLLNKSIKTIQNTIEALTEINAISITEDGYIVIENYEKLYVKPNETFPSDQDPLPILEQLFSIKMKDNSEEEKKDSTDWKNIFNKDQDILNKINRSEPYNIRSSKGCKMVDTKQVGADNKASNYKVMDQNISDKELDRIFC